MRGATKNQGFSLVEMMIGLLIGGMVILSISSYLQNMRSRQATSLGREAAMTSSKMLLDLIKRDMSYQTTHAISDGGHTLKITRKKIFTLGSTDGTYDISFRSVCRRLPADPPEAAKLLQKVYSGQNKKVFDNSALACMQDLACKKGAFPQVEIVLSEVGQGVPRYAKTIFPVVSSQIQRESLGTSLCFQTVGDKIRVRTESAFLVDHKEGTVRVVGGEIILPKAPQTLDILPD